MTDYSNMSDFEINAAVATAQFGNWESNADIYPLITRNRIDYCNNPADAWPIIKNNKISLTPPRVDDRWDCCTYDKFGYVNHEHYDANPFRAAMIVFLMMKDAEKC